MKYRITLLLLLQFIFQAAFSQSNPSTWIELELSKKIVKNLKVELNPELRLFGGFEMDTYIIEGGFAYKLHKHLTTAAYYRFQNEYKYRKKLDIYEYESSNRFAFDAKSGFSLKRFDFQLRVRYTNGSEDDKDTGKKPSFFRYRAKTEYNIKNLKITPFASVEVFHDLNLKELDKTRYSGGITYPLNKNNELSMFYRIQDYSDIRPNVNIIGFGYDLKL